MVTGFVRNEVVLQTIEQTISPPCDTTVKNR